MDPRQELQTLVDQLATQRDELVVQAHLAKLEAREEWQELEDKLDALRGKAAEAADVASDAAGNVVAAARLIGEEIASGYERLRRLF